ATSGRVTRGRRGTGDRCIAVPPASRVRRVLLRATRRAARAGRIAGGSKRAVSGRGRLRSRAPARVSSLRTDRRAVEGAAGDRGRHGSGPTHASAAAGRCRLGQDGRGVRSRAGGGTQRGTG